MGKIVNYIRNQKLKKGGGFFPAFTVQSILQREKVSKNSFLYSIAEGFNFTYY